jgi:hypothetical protein
MQYNDFSVYHLPLYYKYEYLIQDRSCTTVRRTQGVKHNDVGHIIFEKYTYTGKGKAVPLQAWIGPEGSRKLRFPDFLTTAQDGSKVVSHTPRPHLLPGNISGTHFC